MAQRYPNQGYQPPRARGMPNRGMPNRNVYNQGFRQNQSMSNWEGQTNQTMNNNERFQRNSGVSNRGRPRMELHSNQGFQGNQHMQNRPMFNPGMDRSHGPNQNYKDIPETRFNNSQGYQTNRHAPNTDRSNFSSDIKTHQGFQSDRDFPNRDVSNSGMRSSQDFQSDQCFPNSDVTGSQIATNLDFQNNQGFSNRSASISGMRTNQFFQINQDISERGMQNSGMSTNQGFHQSHNMPNRDKEASQDFQIKQGFHGTGHSNLELNTNQNFQTNQGLPNRGRSNFEMNTNQNFQTNQGLPNRERSNFEMNANQNFQTNHGFPERDMSNLEMNTNQSFQINQGLTSRSPLNSEISTNQGFQINQGLPNRGQCNPGFRINQGRGLYNPERNTNQDFQTSQGLPNRGLPIHEMNTSQGFQTNQGLPNGGPSNPGMIMNQGFQTNQSLPNRNPGMSINKNMFNRNLPDPDISQRLNQGFQSNQSLVDRSMTYQRSNTSHVFQKNRDMPNRDMSNPGIVTGQGFQTNQNIPSRVPGSEMNNLSINNQHNYNQDTTFRNFHVSGEKHPGNALQGSDGFHIHQDTQSSGNSEGHMGSLGMQPCSVPPNAMSQAPIVQHVMIPVPVPVGTDIPPHLLRPQIITSSNQSLFPGQQKSNIQNQVNVANIQGQFPISQGQYQGQNQTQNVLDQRSMSEYSSQNRAQMSDISRSSSGINDLSYYMGKESKNVKGDHSTMDSFHSSVDQQGINEEKYGNRAKHVEDNSHLGSGRFQMRHDKFEKERVRDENYSSYSSEYFEKSEQETLRKSSDTQMFDKEHVESYRKHDDYYMKSKDIPKTGEFKYMERDKTFERQNRFRREHEHQLEYEIEREYDMGRNDGYDGHDSPWLSNNYRDNQKVKQSNDHRDEQTFESDRRSVSVRYTDSNLENRRTPDFASKFERHSDMHVYSDRNSDKPTEKQMNENKQSSDAFADKDKRVDDSERSIPHFVRDKRKQSPVSGEISSKKLKKAYSPVPDNKVHGELKIHVSDKGRWIEGNCELSPVSDCADESERNYAERNKADINNFKHKVAQNDQASLDGAEMVSDSESYIEDMSDDKLKIHVHDLSPVSQQSPSYESDGNEKKSVNVLNSDADRVSPNRSVSSRYSEEKRSQSNRSKHSSDWQIEKRKPLEMSEASDRKMTQNNLKVPDLCRSHNQKGCCWDGCASLHVCKFFVIDQCKFGDHCSKGHDFFNSHSYSVLNKENPGIRNNNATSEKIKAILKERILSSTPASYNKKLNSNYTGKEISSIDDPFNEVVAADPSFDARNYATGNIVDAREKLDKKKSFINASKTKSEHSHISEEKTKKEKESTASKKEKFGKKTNKKKDTVNESKYKLKAKKGGDRNDKKMKGKSKPAQTAESNIENVLSPVSGDEDDWEKYEKYERISDNDLSEKEDDLDNVSSDESIIEQVQVNRSVDNFPLPTPENIAVPIGMNDPLVFNRPLKNNPQSYIGPMNRPPPMFPLTGENNAPLFPVIAQQNQPGFTGMPVAGHMPNYLPSPSFMKEVIKNLPPFKVESTGKNIFKNDNNPRSEVCSQKRKIKADKVEKEPELKETIKKLWKFPHKGIINMSIIEFVTETEAYKEEFIAEIVKILVTLELPYVTMKKLLSVIKEKVSINVKSETDMRKILEMYPNNFKIMEMVDSDDESNDSDAKKNIQIKANIGVGFCEKHGFLPFALGKCECNALHLCKFYFLSDCPVKLCKFGHKLKTDHNVAVLKQHKLHRLTGEEILNFLADIDNRNKETIPSICKYYIREKGCYKGDNIDFETICHNLHLCAYILKGKCMNRECDRSHSIHDKQPLSLLKKYGLDPEEFGDEKILLILGDKCIDNEKGKRVTSGKQNQAIKSISSSSSSKSSTLRKDKGGKDDSSKSAGEGLTIISHSETRFSSKYFVQNFKVPAVCKFYQNALGCRKKDWGAAGKCFFLHVCQHYVAGDCNYGDKCKRSHDLFSGQAAEILEKYNFDLDNLTAPEILKRLNNNSGAPVELPSAGKNLNVDIENVEMTIDSIGEPDEIDLSNFEVSKQTIEDEISVTSRENSEKEERKKELSKPKAIMKSGTKSALFSSDNVEDVIKHIMEHNKVDKK